MKTVFGAENFSLNRLIFLFILPISSGRVAKTGKALAVLLCEDDPVPAKSGSGTRRDRCADNFGLLGVAVKNAAL